jgi:hypothetical protein
VKGYFGPKSKKTTWLFRAQYPEIPLVLATLPVMLALGLTRKQLEGAVENGAD